MDGDLPLLQLTSRQQRLVHMEKMAALEDRSCGVKPPLKFLPSPNPAICRLHPQNIQVFTNLELVTLVRVEGLCPLHSQREQFTSVLHSWQTRQVKVSLDSSNSKTIGPWERGRQAPTQTHAHTSPHPMITCDDKNN